MDHVGSLGKTLILFVSLGIDKILGFSGLSGYTEVVLLKTFQKYTLNYTSTANIEEAMTFYNLGDKSFETDLISQLILLNTWKSTTLTF